MKLVSWNVNGIRAIIKKGNLTNFIDEVNPDIICLQEIKAREDQVNLTEFQKEYHIFWNSAEKAGYSGTLIMSKEMPLSVVSNFPEDIIKKYKLRNDSYGDVTKEGRLVAIELNNCWVVNTYVPNSKGDLSRLELRYAQWGPAMIAFLKELEKNKPVLLCGDFNVAHEEIDIANPKSNKGKHGFTTEERTDFSNMINSGFVDIYRYKHPDTIIYTWWSNLANSRARNMGWRIDYWIVSQILAKSVKSEVIYNSVLGSDHCPIGLDIE
jgi:exodeoxyribonuclease-3